MGLYTYNIHIDGIVQGVGFRPFIYSLAIKYNLFGTVCNNTKGVDIVLYCEEIKIQEFIKAIKDTLPPLADIDNISIHKIKTQKFTNFQIIENSNKGEKTTLIPPDVSICKECELELFDTKNRRYKYPFISCSYCGIRYSIIYDLPYDRSQTSMKYFKMCDKCEKEYTNPNDRRYHTQPIGCYECGPSLQLLDNASNEIKCDDSLNQTIKLLKDGNIIAIKGVGGYHLVCDATNDTVVSRLRKLKHRVSKPLAIMVKDIAMAKKIAKINKKENELLNSKEKPIVILNSLCENTLYDISHKVAPNISKIGILLPYTPLHLLLLDKINRPLVVTSANISNEPICSNLDDLLKIQDVYDYILNNDRDIINSCDDSVVMVVKNQEVIIRRARGYAPLSIKLKEKLKKNILSLGANQKSTIAIGFDKNIILSPHIGDLHNLSSISHYKKNLNSLFRIYDFKPDIIVCDKHKMYESSKIANELKKENKNIQIIQAQHHHAHILSVMIEKQIKTKVLGVAFDGNGYGDDGNFWGGEFLLCENNKYKRVAHIKYFKLLGGERAIKEPKRIALSLLFDIHNKKALDLDNKTIKSFSNTELNIHFQAWEKEINTTLSSSMGRIFDGVASLLDICHIISFEGESGILLEELYNKNVQGHYTFTYINNIINILPMIEEILKEKDKNIAVSRFFNTIVEIIITIDKEYNIPLILSGGVFQNKVLLTIILEKIPTAIISNKVPSNDGGISLGQIGII